MNFKFGVLLSLILSSAITLPSFARTDRDLRSRIAIDGLIEDYIQDEWVLDSATPFPEPRGDSRWGSDNDIRGIAVTWDSLALYIAVDCSIAGTSIVLCIDCGCGGLTDLQEFQPLQRNIIFRGCTPNLFVHGIRAFTHPRAHFIDCSNAPRELFAGEYSAVLYQGEYDSGALECALPWELFSGFGKVGGDVILPAAGAALRLLAAVSGGNATGAGDAAPDPPTLLDSDSTSTAVLDNYLLVPLDADGDGKLDFDIAPRGSVSPARSERAELVAVPDVTIEVDTKACAPDAGERIMFRPVFETAPASAVPVTARIFSVSGALVRTLYVDRPLTPESNPADLWEEWDGRDADGSIVPGGMYIIAICAGNGGVGGKRIAKEAIAIIR